ncbi:MAG TPA: hypothetical protein VNU97_13210 [Rhizomicrobium sp.]|jgi:predicted transcriptional regulator|nr:hypothetical protein [Rhizomicrobium sp.]
MTKDVTLSLRVDRKLSGKLEKAAKTLRRSKSSIAAMAIEHFMELDAREMELTAQALQRAEAGGPFISHEDMAKWMRSMATGCELPPPKATLKY